MACRLGVEMPICAAVDAVLNGGADLDATIAGLLARPRKEEVFAAEANSLNPCRPAAGGRETFDGGRRGR